MKNVLSLFSMVIIFSLFSSRLTAGTIYGAGISINPTAFFPENDETLFLPSGMATFYLPIKFGESFTLEPEFGIYLRSAKEESYNEDISFSRFGLGLFHGLMKKENFSMNLGARLAYLSNSTEISNDGETISEISQSALSIGLCLGGEYFLSNYFSIGLEMQANYFIYEIPTVRPADFEFNRFEQNILSTNGLLFFRFYFNSDNQDKN